MAAGDSVRSQRPGTWTRKGAEQPRCGSRISWAISRGAAYADEQRAIEASRRNRKLAATALMRMGGDCPPEWEDVATELILHSQYSWSQIARRLGVTRGQAVYRFRRLLSAADVDDSGISSQDVPSPRRA
jgi:hypothetical protein